MRIGFDVSKALDRDGVGTYVAGLLAGLAGLDADVELRLYALRGRIERAALETRLGGLPARFRLLDEVAGLDGLDVFHATAWTCPPGFDGPLLVTGYDLTFLTHPHCHTVVNKVHSLGGLLRALLADAHFLAISDATAAALRREIGVAAARIDVVYPAPSPEIRPVATDEARRRVAERFELDAAPVLAVGTLEPRKNLERLIAAHATLPPALQRDHPLVLAGGAGWRDGRIVRAIERHGEVRRLGLVSSEALSALYSVAAVFAYPSLAEGFGLPVVEAMVCGAPVLTSSTGALAEVAGDAARLVDPLDREAIGDALRELLEDPDERRRLGERGRRRAAEFSWRRCAEETLAVYAKLAERGR